ncbi:hypothetical protein HG530_013109 [Fusarium avenaceum]|nr:hypothetical protein HG530_013109 [Fusarium avenaceum]
MTRSESFRPIRSQHLLPSTGPLPVGSNEKVVVVLLTIRQVNFNAIFQLLEALDGCPKYDLYTIFDVVVQQPDKVTSHDLIIRGETLKPLAGLVYRKVCHYFTSAIDELQSFLLD